MRRHFRSCQPPMSAARLPASAGPQDPGSYTSRLRNADHGDVQRSVSHHIVQCGENLFVGQISGCPKQNECIRLRLACGLTFQLDRKLWRRHELLVKSRSTDEAASHGWDRGETGTYHRSSVHPSVIVRHVKCRRGRVHTSSAQVPMRSHRSAPGGQFTRSVR